MPYLSYILGGCLSYILSSLICWWIIRHKGRLAQPISDALPSHARKRGTPTMGGIGIFAPYVLISLLEQNESLPVVLLAFFCGSLDDVSKVLSKRNRGLSKTSKLVILGSGIFAYWTLLRGFSPYPAFIATFAILVFTAAYGVTDGLDGLLGSISALVLSALFVFGYRSCHTASLIGALLGFLRYNWSPAKIFMGDCGSLALGALVGQMYVSSNYKPTFLIISIVPLFNLASVTVKIALAKLGIRYKLLAPIHHELERRMGEVNAVKLLVVLTSLGCLFMFYLLS